MNTTAKRQRLHQLVDVASKGNIEVLLNYMEDAIQPVGHYDKWEDEDFVAEQERRIKNLGAAVTKRSAKG